MVPTPAEYVLLMEHLSCTPVSATQIQTFTNRDPTLAKVKGFVQHGWPLQLDKSPELRPYVSRKDELSTEGGCLLWGQRVVVPPQARKRVLIQLHETHPGICKMKALARQYVWWPGMNGDLEKMVKNCVG